MIKDLNLWLEDIKLPREKTEEIRQAIGVGKDFLGKTSAAQAIKAKTDKWDYIKRRSFFTKKGGGNQQNGRKYLQT